MKPLPTDEFLPTRNSLLSRLRNWDDHASWRDFFDLYWKFLFSIAIRSGLSDADARDVVQETVIAVARGLREKRFQTGGTSSFKAWLQIIMQRRVIDHLRRAKARANSLHENQENQATGEELQATDIPEAEVVREIWEQEWARNVADAAIERVKLRTGIRQFQMFDLYVLKQWPVREVAETLGVSIAQVYLAKHRVTALIKQEVQTLRDRMEIDGGFAHE